MVELPLIIMAVFGLIFILVIFVDIIKPGTYWNRGAIFEGPGLIILLLLISISIIAVLFYVGLVTVPT